MFLKLAHINMDVFNCSKQLVLAVYALTKKFPDYERFLLTQQIRRAALSVHLNIAEGCSRKSLVERKRFYEISRGSVIEIDTALDIAFELAYANRNEFQPTGDLIVRNFSMLSGMISE